MKVAVIDMGTNTFHLMIAEVEKQDYKILSKERIAVKIGEKGINKDEITKAAWARGLNALIEFKGKIDDAKIQKVYATATSAVRNAKNGEAFAAAIKEATGIEISIISGTREAELIHLGASEAVKLGDQKHLIMDIGGGSIEFIIADGSATHWLRSFEIGGQRLLELFHHTDPISETEIADLQGFFEDELVELYDACKAFLPVDLIGCSGTFDTLSDIYCKKEGISKSELSFEYPFSKSAFSTIYQELISKNKAERLLIPGMIEMRVEMIVVASVLIDHLMRRISLNEIRVSGYALKEGILFDALNKIRSQNSDS